MYVKKEQSLEESPLILKKIQMWIKFMDFDFFFAKLEIVHGFFFWNLEKVRRYLYTKSQKLKNFMDIEMFMHLKKVQGFRKINHGFLKCLQVFKKFIIWKKFTNKKFGKRSWKLEKSQV